MSFPISQNCSDSQPVPLGLGKLIAPYPLNRRSHHYWQAIAGFVFFFILGVSLLAAGGLSTYSSVTQFGPSVTWKMMQWPFFLGAFSVLIGLIICLRFLAFRRQSIELYEFGFIYRQGINYLSWRWDEISTIQVKVDRQSFGILFGQVQHRYRLTSPVHKDLVLDDRFSQVEKFVERVQLVVFPKHYAQAAQVYNQGNLLEFGPISLNKTGIKIKQKDYTWEAVGTAQVSQGYLVFPLQGNQLPGGLRTAVELIPNFEVLVAILKYISKWQST